MEIRSRRLVSSSGLWLIAFLCVLPGRADAQLGTRPIQGPNRPTTSPYLGLLNTNGNSAAINYYTQVRPQRQLRAGAAALQQQLRDVEQKVDEGVTYDEVGVPLLPQSGHGTSFMNQRGYFGTGPSNSSSAQASSASTSFGTKPQNSRSASTGGRGPNVGPRTARPNIRGMGNY